MSLVENTKTLKFAIFIMSFLLIVMLFVFIFVIPGIKEYKTKKAQYISLQKNKLSLEEQKKELEKKLSFLKKENVDAIKSFSNDFNQSEFLLFSKKFFENIKLTHIKNQKTENGLEIYKFTADFNAKTPIRFYNFIDGLKNLKSVVKINFPIKLTSEGKSIKLVFNMSVYRLKHKSK